MNDLNRVLKEGLYGDNTHIDTLKGLSELTDIQAKDKPIEGSHSSYEILFHMIYWQDLLIEGLSEGEYFKEKFANTNWPTDNDYKNLSWENLLEHFTKGVKIAEDVISNSDLTKEIKEANGEPALKSILVLLQHNSFHLGQIVQVRKAHGSWNF
ncbi:MAG: DinB family protein [Candidatus Hodarchaeales archaeon]|jgi:hypothetical protein